MATDLETYATLVKTIFVDDMNHSMRRHEVKRDYFAFGFIAITNGPLDLGT
jgi:hypothetical protein